MSGEALAFVLDSMPDDIKSSPGLAKFKTVDEMARSYLSLESKLGADKNHLFLIPKDGDINAMPDLWKHLGKPEKYEVPTDLKTKLPDDYLQRLTERVSKLNLTDTQFKELMYFTDQEAVAAGERSTTAAAARKTESENAIKTAFGKTYDQNMNAAKDALEMFGKGATWAKLEAAGLTTDPDLMGFMADVGRMGGEHRFVSGGAGGKGGGFGMSPAQANAEITRLRSGADAAFTTAFNDKLNPGHKAAVDRMQDLYKTAANEGQAE